jgi:predicted porin
MKKTLVALAALAATSAFAQSSVTISGQIEMGVSKSAAGAYSVGDLKGDRTFITFAAVEDLGGGLKAGATAQMRWNPEQGNASYANTVTGTADASLMEQSSVFISSASFGELKMGRFSTHLTAAPGHFTEDWASGASSSAAYGRSSGQTQYTTPTFGGLNVFVLHAKGDVNVKGLAGNGYDAATTAYAPKDLSAMGLNYNKGPIAVQLTSLTGFQGEKAQIINAAYDFGVAKIAVNQYHQKDNMVAMAAHKSTEYGVQVPMNKWTFGLAKLNNDKNVGRNGGADVADTKRSVTAATAKYALSKRTYAEAWVSSTKQAYAAAGTADTAANGTAQYIGLAHSF